MEGNVSIYLSVGWQASRQTIVVMQFVSALLSPVWDLLVEDNEISALICHNSAFIKVWCSRTHCN